MSEGRFPVLLAVALGLGVVTVILLPRPPDNAIPVPGYDGWSPQPAFDGEGGASYPQFDGRPYRGQETWTTAEGSNLIWKLGDEPFASIQFSVQGEFEIDLLALGNSSGFLGLGPPQVSGAALAASFEPMGESSGPLRMRLGSSNGESPVFTAGTPVTLTSSVRGYLGPVFIDSKPAVELRAAPADRLELRASFHIDPAAHEWSSDWSALLDTLRSAGAENAPMWVEMVITLSRSPR